jgi:hypothetical protein
MMKKSLVLLVLFFWVGISAAQYADAGFGYWGNQPNHLIGGVGFTKIDDQSYFSIGFRPELSFGKFGIGLNINLLYNTDTGAIRAKDWNSGYDYFRILRYLRYGRKLDPVYARVGTLDASRIGHGFIVNYYTNEANYDERKIGLEFDLDLGHFGFETMASNVGRAELLGARAYYRPLYGLKLPVLKNVAIGASIARDMDPDTWVATDDGVSVYGMDIELPIIKTSVFNTMLYVDWAQISGYSSVENKSRDFGSGTAVGISAGLGNLFGLLELQARLERRWLGKEFMPSFFDPFYDLQRFQVFGQDKYHKADLLIGLEKTKGTFGELYGNLLGNKVRLLGMLSKLDNESNGNMHLAADATEAIPVVAAHATYDKIGITKVKDVFTLDNDSVARVGLGYKIKPYLVLYMDYIWTFVEKTPGSKIYQPQERIEPKIAFVYNFK